MSLIGLALALTLALLTLGKPSSDEQTDDSWRSVALGALLFVLCLLSVYHAHKQREESDE